MRSVDAVGKWVRRRWRVRQADRIHARYAPYTMVPRRQFRANLLLCRELAPRQGVVVECGVWRGGMSAGMADEMPGRKHYLFDSFEGLPPARDIDGDRALAYQRDVDAPAYRDNCRAELAEAETAMRRSAAAGFELIKGWFEETVPRFDPAEGIAVLRLDADWYDSTMICLNHLFPLVVQGGLVLIDDYATWDGCTRAVHDYLSRNNLAEPIRRTSEDVFYIRKRGGDGS